MLKDMLVVIAGMLNMQPLSGWFVLHAQHHAHHNALSFLGLGSAGAECAVPVLCGAAQVPVRIIQIDSSGGQEASVVDMKPEGLSAEEQAALGPPKVHMLYRPGEWWCTTLHHE